MYSYLPCKLLLREGFRAVLGREVLWLRVLIPEKSNSISNPCPVRAFHYTSIGNSLPSITGMLPLKSPQKHRSVHFSATLVDVRISELPLYKGLRSRLSLRAQLHCSCSPDILRVNSICNVSLKENDVLSVSAELVDRNANGHQFLSIKLSQCNYSIQYNCYIKHGHSVDYDLGIPSVRCR